MKEGSHATDWPKNWESFSHRPLFSVPPHRERVRTSEVERRFKTLDLRPSSKGRQSGSCPTSNSLTSDRPTLFTPTVDDGKKEVYSSVTTTVDGPCQEVQQGCTTRRPVVSCGLNENPTLEVWLGDWNPSSTSHVPLTSVTEKVTKSRHLPSREIRVSVRKGEWKRGRGEGQVES